MAESTHHRWTEIEIRPYGMNPLVTQQNVVGTHTVLTRLVLKKGAHFHGHYHDNEEISHVVEGSLQFLIEGKELLVGAGEILCIPPRVIHEVVALEDSVALEICNLTRQDWVD